MTSTLTMRRQQRQRQRQRHQRLNSVLWKVVTAGIVTAAAAAAANTIASDHKEEQSSYGLNGRRRRLRSLAGNPALDAFFDNDGGGDDNNNGPSLVVQPVGPPIGSPATTTTTGRFIFTQQPIGQQQQPGEQKIGNNALDSFFNNRPSVGQPVGPPVSDQPELDRGNNPTGARPSPDVSTPTYDGTVPTQNTYSTNFVPTMYPTGAKPVTLATPRPTPRPTPNPTPDPTPVPTKSPAATFPSQLHPPNAYPTKKPPSPPPVVYPTKQPPPPVGEMTPRPTAPTNPVPTTTSPPVPSPTPLPQQPPTMVPPTQQPPPTLAPPTPLPPTMVPPTMAPPTMAPPTQPPPTVAPPTPPPPTMVPPTMAPPTQPPPTVAPPTPPPPTMAPLPQPTVQPVSPTECATITEIACNTPGFETLCELILELGLDFIFSDPELNLTVFAPNNAAFDGVIDDLLLLTPEEVGGILLYHTINGVVFSTDLVCGADVEMVNGLSTQTQCPVDGTFFQVGGGNMEPNLPQIITVDIPACNGVVHIVDNVILPPAMGLRDSTPMPSLSFTSLRQCSTITQQVCNTPGFETLCTLLVQAGLDEDLNNPSLTFTLFAPDNAAFDEIANILQTLSPDDVINILQYHTVNVEVFSTDLKCDTDIEMVNGLSTRTQCPAEGAFLQVGVANTDNNLPQITARDIPACNGVIHIVNDVILPGTPSTAPTNTPIPTVVPSASQSAGLTASPTVSMAPTNNPAPGPNSPPTPQPRQDICAGRQTITEIMCTSPNFTFTCNFLRQTGLDAVLDDPNADFTFFAPANVGWAVADPFIPPNLANNQLEFLLLYHVTQGTILSTDLVVGQPLPMLNGLNSATIEIIDIFGEFFQFQTGVGNTNENIPQLGTVNVVACNGIIHTLTSVILPSSLPPPVAPTNAPVPAPTNPPVPAPTNPPVPAPTNPPVPAPTNPPVPAPTNPPVPVPTNPPVPAPTSPPVPAPTNPPVPAPTNAPVPAPTNPPVAAPTNPPGTVRSNPLTLSYRKEATDQEALFSDITGGGTGSADPGLTAVTISYIESYLQNIGITATGLTLLDNQAGQVFDPPVAFVEWIVEGQFEPSEEVPNTQELDRLLIAMFRDDDGQIDDYRTMFVNTLPSSNYFGGTTLALAEDGFPLSRVRVFGEENVLPEEITFANQGEN